MVECRIIPDLVNPMTESNKPPHDRSAATGLRSWLLTVDHKRIGVMYLVVTLFFFLTGGLMALVIRLQLETASGTVVSAETYDQIFTMHGTTMVFLFTVPVAPRSATTWCRFRSAPATWPSRS